jgi:HSP20 family protein
VNESSSSAPGRGALAELKQAIGSLIEQVAGLAPDLGLGREFPRHELRVEDDGYRARLELPGVTRDEVEVSLAGRNLTVSGERRRFEPPAGAHMLRRERPSGRFSATIRLPGDVDPLGVVAKMKDGVLDVWMPRPGPRGRNIEVESVDEPADRGAATGEPEGPASAPSSTPERAEAAAAEPEATRGPEAARPQPAEEIRMPWEEGPATDESRNDPEGEPEL